eukprot:TRINITY_DN20468_c0_g1_i1.p1 TRINITY_DN20468_c0_g1~~TRINITY_DN20468_c0_g1_i1.p1  ORF type:complete len:1145 (-),score=199.90 TRINITY_DN20468_c0_g1_i1:80-3514(-)
MQAKPMTPGQSGLASSPGYEALATVSPTPSSEKSPAKENKLSTRGCIFPSLGSPPPQAARDCSRDAEDKQSTFSPVSQRLFQHEMPQVEHSPLEQQPQKELSDERESDVTPQQSPRPNPLLAAAKRSRASQSPIVSPRTAKPPSVAFTSSPPSQQMQQQTSARDVQEQFGLARVNPLLAGSPAVCRTASPVGGSSVRSSPRSIMPSPRSPRSSMPFPDTQQHLEELRAAEGSRAVACSISSSSRTASPRTLNRDDVEPSAFLNMLVAAASPLPATKPAAMLGGSPEASMEKRPFADPAQSLGKTWSDLAMERRLGGNRRAEASSSAPTEDRRWMRQVSGRSKSTKLGRGGSGPKFETASDDGSNFAHSLSLPSGNRSMQRLAVLGPAAATIGSRQGGSADRLSKISSSPSLTDDGYENLPRPFWMGVCDEVVEENSAAGCGAQADMEGERRFSFGPTYKPGGVAPHRPPQHGRRQPAIVRLKRVHEIQAAVQDMGPHADEYAAACRQLQLQRAIGACDVDLLALALWYLPYAVGVVIYAMVLTWCDIVFKVIFQSRPLGDSAAEVPGKLPTLALPLNIPLIVGLVISHLVRLTWHDYALYMAVDACAIADVREQLRISYADITAGCMFSAYLATALQATKVAHQELLFRPPKRRVPYRPLTCVMWLLGLQVLLRCVQWWLGVDLAQDRGWQMLEVVTAVLSIVATTLGACSPRHACPRAAEADFRLEALEAGFCALLDALRPLRLSTASQASHGSQPDAAILDVGAADRVSVRLCTAECQMLRATVHVNFTQRQMSVVCPLGSFRIVASRVCGLTSFDLGVADVVASTGESARSPAMGSNSKAASRSHPGLGRMRLGCARRLRLLTASAIYGKRALEDDEAAEAGFADDQPLRSPMTTSPLVKDGSTSESAQIAAIDMVNALIDRHGKRPLEVFHQQDRSGHRMTIPMRQSSEEPCLVLVLEENELRTMDYDGPLCESIFSMQDYWPMKATRKKGLHGATVLHSMGEIRRLFCCGRKQSGDSLHSTPNAAADSPKERAFFNDMEKDCEGDRDAETPSSPATSWSVRGMADGLASGQQVAKHDDRLGHLARVGDASAKHLVLVFDTSQERDMLLFLLRAAGVTTATEDKQGGLSRSPRSMPKPSE